MAGTRTSRSLAVASRWVVRRGVALGASVAAACGGGEPPMDPSLLPFVHRVVDDRPPGGAECCTDVLAVGDLDGDGLPDLAVGGEGADREGLVWYRAPGWQRRGIARGQFTTDAAIADVDGDGRPDLVACDHGRGIFWYRNPVPGPDATWLPQRIGDGYAHDLAAADLVGDRRIEIVVCDKQRVTLWRSGADGWRGEVLLAAPGEGLELADVDGDGRPDVCCGAAWLRNPGDAPGPWPRFRVAPDWPVDTRVRAGDIDGDGRIDLVLSASEGPGRISWFAAPADPRQAPWREHVVLDADLEGVHSLRVADLDLDGDADLVAAEMHTSARRRVLLCHQDKGDRWRVAVLANTGSHNLCVADLGADGDADLIGKNFAGAGRRLEIWENRVADRRR